MGLGTGSTGKPNAKRHKNDSQFVIWEFSTAAFVFDTGVYDFDTVRLEKPGRTPDPRVNSRIICGWLTPARENGGTLTCELGIMADPSSISQEPQLLAWYRQSGDLRTLGELYSPYMDLVYGVCLKYLRDRESAKDAVLAIFEVLVLKLRQHEVIRFKPWLYSLAKNHCLMQLRADRRRPGVFASQDLVELPAEEHPDPEWEPDRRMGNLSRCLESLSPDQQAAIKLFYLEGISYKEIALRTNQDGNKIRSQIQNGKRNLKICLEQQESLNRKKSAHE
jgi:RNA polymerase sigma-70 factor (ECF subfamily)